MAKLLEKLKLKEQFDYPLEIDKDVFLQTLSEMVDKGSSSDLFSKQFDKNVDGDGYYIGSVSKGDFRIRKRYALLNNNSSIAIGKIITENNNSSVSTKVTAFNDGNIYAPIMSLILYIGFSIAWHSHFAESFLVFFRNISILFVLIIVILFVLMRKAVADLRAEIEVDFDFIQIKNRKKTDE